MRKPILLLAIALLLLSIAAASAQPLTAKASYSIHFKPVLTAVKIEEGHEEENILFSDTIQLQWGLKVEPHP